MMYFIFRNYTVEPFFKDIDATFSGYQDISYIDHNADAYIWFYLPYIHADTSMASAQISDYAKQAEWVFSKISRTKTILALEMPDYFFIRYEITDLTLSNAIKAYNNVLLELSKSHANVRYLETNSFFNRYDHRILIDWKYYFLSQIPLNPQIIKDFSQWLSHQTEILQFKRKKCLVLDLDNTLWGGILGEEGATGIKIGGDYPGNAFLFFQQCLLELSRKGIILAVCSKNNEPEVLEVWEKNPFLVLRKEQFVAWQINWNDKATNIKAIANDLNIGLDSMVFLDDNPRERELVKQMLPMVEVPDFPEQPYLLPSFFTELVDQYFTAYQLNEEDIRKTGQYKENTERKAHAATYADMKDYLANLHMEIEIQKASPYNIPRIAQMTQKTNQFNLTTQRYTASDLYRILSHNHWIYCFSVKDKFGDFGIVGALIGLIKENRMNVNSFLMSCRALGRGIEHAVFHFFLQMMKEKGIYEVWASYIPTPKNHQVKDFYDQTGFQLVTESDGKKTYRLDLTDYPVKSFPDYKIHAENEKPN